MPRTPAQALGFLLGFAIALWLSPLTGNEVRAEDRAKAPFAQFEADLHARVLALRDQRHLPPLLRRADLDSVARAHAQDMAQRSYLDHVSPEGSNPLTRIQQSGVLGFTLAAENIGKTNRDDPTREVLGGWIASVVHRENLEAPSFNATGIGVARAVDGSFIYTQLYATFPRYE